MADLDENIEEMVGTTREVAAMATESGRDETATRSRTRPATTGGVMYTDEGELEFDEDEMTALQGQHLVEEFRCGMVSKFRV